MRILRFIFNLYLDASLHVSLAVLSLTAITYAFLGNEPDCFLLGFVFCASVVCYNFVKYGVEAHKYIIVSNWYHRLIQGLSFISFAGALYFLWPQSRIVWITVLVLSMVSMLYAVPMLPNAKNLRSLGGFKIYIVALVWTGFTVLLPTFEAELPVSWDVGLMAAQRFLLVLVLMLPFEIRDMQWDNRALKTLPQIIGVNNTKKLGLFLSALFFSMTFFRDSVDQKEILLRMVLALALGFSFLKNQEKQSKYFASFWIEGIPILWLLLVILADRIF